MSADQLRAALQAALGEALTPSLEAGLAAFERLLTGANERTNLTRIEAGEAFLEKHALDALLAAPHLLPGPLVDVGSGGGVPGIPLALLDPTRPVTLIEATGRKAEFLRQAAEELGLTRVRVLALRAEAAGHDRGLREQAAVATARAVGPVATCLELTLPLVGPGGRVLLYRGPAQAEEELAEAAAVAPLLGGGPPQAIRTRLPSGAERLLLLVPKLAPTPERFPRRDGVPAQRPLKG